MPEACTLQERGVPSLLCLLHNTDARHTHVGYCGTAAAQEASIAGCARFFTHTIIQQDEQEGHAQTTLVQA